MKKMILPILALPVLSLTLSAPFVNAEAVDSKKITVLSAFDNSSDNRLAKNPSKATIQDNLVTYVNDSLNHNQKIQLFDENKRWIALDKATAVEGMQLIRFGLSTDRFVVGTLKVEGAKSSTLYLNGNKQTGSNTFKLSLINGDYRAILMLEDVESWDKLKVDWKSDHESQVVSFNDDEQKKRPSMRQFYDAETISAINLSPNGKYLIWSKVSYGDSTEDKGQTVSEIYHIEDDRVIYRWNGSVPTSAQWRDDSKAIAYLSQGDIKLLTIDNLSEQTIAREMKGVRSFQWYDNKSLLLSWHQDEKKPHKFTKRYRAVEDRWSYWRGNSQVHLLDIQSGFVKQITNNEISSSLFDSKKGKLLISRSPINYQEPAHYLTQLFEVDIKSGNEEKLGEYRTFNSAKYHSNGIVFTAGPDLLANTNGVGSILEEGRYANNYDGQLYLRDKKGEISPLSKNFKPAIGGFDVLKNGDLILSTTDQDKRSLYRYSFRSKKFSKINTNVEVVESYSVSNESKATVVYKGSSATKPQKLSVYKVGSSKHKTLLDTASTEFTNNIFIELKDWDYTTKTGNQIDGRVYMPANFDESKKYPALIYYYGGTSPVSRGFTGRWPFSLWANHGYVVYVLQPSGATGYGQDFSAKHVNAWGLETADDIIESTQAFVKAHPFVDDKRLGNLGASYGGFMTMYLATKTDMFAASISHAGISNLTSYWGHGWWGYAYSGVATKGSFPWNQSEFYTKQSPVFNADKVSTPLLLLHGDSDTNVPVGESHQMYTALKLLGKDVELIEFQGDDHHINKRSHRMRWWKTILAYFDAKLKAQPEWWDSLYPSKT